MGINVTSFLLGLGAAWVAPMIARVIRPLAVEATAAGMGLFEDVRRIAAEQLETFEDIAAEARARRQDALVDSNGHAAADDAETPSEPATSGRASRRASGAGRRRAS